ncbi:FAD-dependent monooxygenase [Salmonella enterica subsp. enterica serovar Newport]|nr:FAD-dependent monooxygenase [Salmonella enterica subsp. enterica serovar Newport]EIO4226876.1 FAD-dependent monooxygenase [Salmonella enterica subsp. enterica serovar Newport]EIO4271464.1 FAD-dependent monooxygenase [Salmonella enterica subsp. enterica serovar Newport]
MTTYTTTDVLICGAGVTGLTLAIELARHGVSFRLIEKRTTPFIGSRGKGIQPRTQEIFEDLGILNKVVAAGGLYPRLRTYRHDGSYVDSDIAHHTKPTHAEPYHLPLMVPQNVTETIIIHHIGEQDELIDTLGHFRESYHLAPGQCVLIRPDGYVGAFFHGKQSNDIENYLSRFAIGIKDEY